MRFPAAILATLAFLAAAPVAAQERAIEGAGAAATATEIWFEVDAHGNQRLLAVPPQEADAALASYGPFRVVDERRAQMVGITDSGSPAHFAAMLRDFPGIAELEMIECPGTHDDQANLRLGRMIRETGMATHVPAGGSVRSGAVEIFIAGARREIDDGAEFAVHAWLDDKGREATDYRSDSPENRKYLTYYREMGMSEQEANAFYAMTNSVSFENARWLDAAEMRGWIDTDGLQGDAPIALARLDLGASLN